MARIVFSLLFSLAAIGQAYSDVGCAGTIDGVYKWHHFNTLSMKVKLDSGVVTRWISLPTQSDEAMALMAFASGKSVHVHWSSSTITDCTPGASSWAENQKLNGWFYVKN